MLDNDQDYFVRLLEDAMSMYGREIKGGQASMWWNALREFPAEIVRHHLSQHVKESRFAPTVADIRDRILESDGRPGPEEAWAAAIQASDEAVSIVWTQEMAEAWFRVVDLYSMDRIGARKSFLEIYQDQVRRARGNGVPAQWSLSAGNDPRGRALAIAEAKWLGRLQPDSCQSAYGHLEHQTCQARQLEGPNTIENKHMSVAEYLSKLRKAVGSSSRAFN